MNQLARSFTCGKMLWKQCKESTSNRPASIRAAELLFVDLGRASCRGMMD